MNELEKKLGIEVGSGYIILHLAMMALANEEIREEIRNRDLYSVEALEEIGDRIFDYVTIIND